MAGKTLMMGYYQHFKGEMFLVTGTRFDHVTNREVVEYEATNYTKTKYVRAINDFQGTIMVDGRTLVDKFKYVGDTLPKSRNISTLNEEAKGIKIYD